MTYQNQSSELIEVVQLFAKQGFEGMAKASVILLPQDLSIHKRIQNLAHLPHVDLMANRQTVNYNS